MRISDYNTECMPMGYTASITVIMDSYTVLIPY